MAKITLLWESSGGGNDAGAPEAPALPLGVCGFRDGVAVADCSAHRVFWIGPEGRVSVLAGTGLSGFGGDGGPATAAYLSGPCGVAEGPEGALYIADTDNRRVRRVTPEGFVSTVAGSGVEPPEDPERLGDGGPATLACLSEVWGLAVGPTGDLYIADTDNNRIRRVGPEGAIETVAGCGPVNLVRHLGSRCLIPIDRGGFTGDGLPAARTRLKGPTGIAVTADGRLLIADRWNHRIREMGADGVIRTVAGVGLPGFAEDGGPAREARLDSPYGVAAGPEGSLYFTEPQHSRVCRVAADGVLETIAGEEDGLSGPAGIDSLPDGSLVVADAYRCWVLRLQP